MTPGLVGIYLCGLTVQSIPHIGHLRSGVNYDVLRRWLLHSGYDVRFIRNITDIDDKILEKSVQEDRPFWAIAYENEQVLAAHYRALNVLPPTYEPLATAHIPDMHELIEMLLASGHAYVSAAKTATSTSTCRPIPITGGCPASIRMTCGRRATGARRTSVTSATSHCGRP